MGYMVEHIGRPAMLEQMAEECAELGKEALKLARVLRNENPTPVTAAEASNAIIEEFTDVVICAGELGYRPSPTIARYKEQRFKQRWEAANASKD